MILTEEADLQIIPVIRAAIDELDALHQPSSIVQDVDRAAAELAAIGGAGHGRSELEIVRSVVADRQPEIGSDRRRALVAFPVRRFAPWFPLHRDALCGRGCLLDRCSLLAYGLLA